MLKSRKICNWSNKSKRKRGKNERELKLKNAREFKRSWRESKRRRKNSAYRERKRSRRRGRSRRGFKKSKRDLRRNDCLRSSKLSKRLKRLCKILIHLKCRRHLTISRFNQYKTRSILHPSFLNVISFNNKLLIFLTHKPKLALILNKRILRWRKKSRTKINTLEEELSDLNIQI